MGLFGSMFGGGGILGGRGIVAGDNPQQEEWWRLIMKGDAGQEPMRNAPGQGRGILGNIAGRSLEDWGSRFGQAGAYFDGDWASGAAIGQARAEQGAKQREAQGAGVHQQALADAMRQEGYTDAQIMLAMQNLKAAGEAAVNKANPKPESPYRFEDNAGNVWQHDARTGQNSRIFTDSAERVVVDPATGALSRVTNPYLNQGAPQSPSLPNGYDPNEWEVVPGPAQGGPMPRASGGFPGRYRR